MTESNAERIARVRRKADNVLSEIEGYREMCGGRDSEILAAWQREYDDMLWLIQQAEIVAGAKELRLFDSQWISIVNHERCWERFTKEEAIRAAVKMTEQQMAKNAMAGTWPQPACGNENQGEKK